MRFETAEEIDNFLDALGIMMFEFASAYKKDDQSFDDIGDMIQSNVSHLADLAKASMEN